MTDTKKVRYIRIYSKSGHCIAEFDSRHVVEINVECENKYEYHRYAGGKKFRMAGAGYKLNSIEIVLLIHNKLDFSTWWRNNYKVMQNVCWIDIMLSNKCTIRYTIENAKVSVSFEQSDMYDEAVIRIIGAEDENE